MRVYFDATIKNFKSDVAVKKGTDGINFVTMQSADYDLEIDNIWLNEDKDGNDFENNEVSLEMAMELSENYIEELDITKSKIAKVISNTLDENYFIKAIKNYFDLSKYDENNIFTNGTLVNSNFFEDFNMPKSIDFEIIDGKFNIKECELNF